MPLEVEADSLLLNLWPYRIHPTLPPLGFGTRGLPFHPLLLWAPLPRALSGVDLAVQEVVFIESLPSDFAGLGRPLMSPTTEGLPPPDDREWGLL
ncbi:hypothetical protein Ancab_005016, partial [Ancistrocladus abbreviatus]